MRDWMMCFRGKKKKKRIKVRMVHYPCSKCCLSWRKAWSLIQPVIEVMRQLEHQTSKHPRCIMFHLFIITLNCRPAMHFFFIQLLLLVWQAAAVAWKMALQEEKGKMAIKAICQGVQQLSKVERKTVRADRSGFSYSLLLLGRCLLAPAAKRSWNTCPSEHFQTCMCPVL